MSFEAQDLLHVTSTTLDLPNLCYHIHLLLKFLLDYALSYSNTNPHCYELWPSPQSYNLTISVQCAHYNTKIVSIVSPNLDLGSGTTQIAHFPPLWLLLSKLFIQMFINLY